MPSLFAFLAVIGDGCVSSSNGLAIRDVVSEVLFGVLDECRFGETLVGQRERRIFGKDFLAGRASEANAPGIDSMNQVVFTDAELSG